jgi:hypothetical protein
MSQEQCQQDQQTADRATVFCLISLLLGTYIIWVNLGPSAVDSASPIYPVVVVAIVHLLGGSVAVYHALRTNHFVRNLHVYGYFAAVLMLAAWLLVTQNLFA